MENQQDYSLTMEQEQVLLTGTFGDGHIKECLSGSSFYMTNCIHKEYINFKKTLLGDIFSGQVNESINHGFKQNTIYTIHTKQLKKITSFHQQTLEEKLKLFRTLGMALWFYDDGSLHQKNNFYNLNTQKFSQEVNEEVIKPYFISLGLKPKVLRETKKDNRVFYYLYFGRHDGAFEITKLLEKYPIPCYNYKLWSSTTTQKWGKLQAELKSRNISVSRRKFGDMINEI